MACFKINSKLVQIFVIDLALHKGIGGDRGVTKSNKKTISAAPQNQRVHLTARSHDDVTFLVSDMVFGGTGGACYLPAFDDRFPIVTTKSTKYSDFDLHFEFLCRRYGIID